VGPASKLSLAAAGLYLLAGMLIGIVKYRRTMTSTNKRAPVYIDIAHRASFMYSFAALVISRLLEFSPYSVRTQLVALAAVLLFFTLTIFGYFMTGLRNETENLFRKRNFTKHWFEL
jgi:hypothetical protein